MSGLYERVEPDSGLSGSEKETTITMYGDAKTATVYSAKPTIVRSLLQHDHFDVVEISGLDDEDNRLYADTEQSARKRLQVIHSIRGEIPVGCLTVKSTRRANDHQSHIVSHETVSADAFGGDSP